MTDLTAVRLSVTIPDLVPLQQEIYARVAVKIKDVEDLIFSPVENIPL